MEKVFQKIDGLPIVRLLQVAAIVIFLISLFHLGEVWHQAFRGPYSPSKESVLNSLMLTTMTLGRILFDPLILLALAEIIKLKKG